MSRIQEKLLLAVSDFFAINVATGTLLWLSFVGGALESAATTWQQLDLPGNEMPFSYALQVYLYDALPLVYCCWLVLFIFSGMYRAEQSLSRLDEAMAVIKVVTMGTFLILIATFDLDNGFSFTRFLLGSYWLSMVCFVAAGRVVLRSLQRRLLQAGIGRLPTLIVGTDERGERLLHDLRSRPVCAHDIVGFVSARCDDERTIIEKVPVLGSVEQLQEIVRERDAKAVLIALRSNSHEEILKIIESVEDPQILFSITPDLYDIVTGHVRTNQIYGVPLMQLKPQLLAPWQQVVKRLIDVTVALVVLLGLSPVWLITAVVIKLTSPGPVLFRQERVGRGGRVFMMYKFRSMRVDAEKKTGPVWVRDDDPRVTVIGRLLRALHLDEIPQCVNFLTGDMSLIGPRPERPFFVDQFARKIPFYMRRFNVKPGLLGWAQSKHEFDLNSKDFHGIARERLEYDLYYIENVSLTLDIKIMMRTIWFVTAGKSTR